MLSLNNSALLKLQYLLSFNVIRVRRIVVLSACFKYYIDFIIDECHTRWRRMSSFTLVLRSATYSLGVECVVCDVYCLYTFSIQEMFESLKVQLHIVFSWLWRTDLWPIENYGLWLYKIIVRCVCVINILSKTVSIVLAVKLKPETWDIILWIWG